MHQKTVDIVIKHGEIFTLKLKTRKLSH